MAATAASEIAQSRMRLDREKQLRIKERGVKLGDFSGMVAEGTADVLPLIIKADVDGSAQAFSDALEHLGTDEVKVHIVHRAVGAINEEDVLLAVTSGAVILGFRARPNTNARKNAERDGVEVRIYDVIYEGVDEIRAVLEGMLTPERKEQIVGSAEVREVFKIKKVGTIAGCEVVDGVVDRKSNVRLIREGVVVYEGDNDTSAGKRSQQLLEDYQEFVEAVLTAQPSTRVVILSIKPSLARWNVWPEMQASNAAIKAYSQTDARVDFVDVGTAMLGVDGLPRPELFVRDGLHMTPAGYDVWDEIVMEALMPGGMHSRHVAGQGVGH